MPLNDVPGPLQKTLDVVAWVVGSLAVMGVAFIVYLIKRMMIR